MTYNDFLTLHILVLFSYSGRFGQVVLWPSLPDRAIKKRENCRSLRMTLFGGLIVVLLFSDLCKTRVLDSLIKQKYGTEEMHCGTED